MLVLGHQGGCLPYVLALVAMLAVGDPVIHEQRDEKTFDPGERRGKRVNWQHPTSDLLGGLKAVGAFEWAGASDGFCLENGLHPKTMKEIHDLRLQLCRIVNTMVIDGESPSLSKEWTADPPSAKQDKLLQQIIISGLIDQVARRIPHEAVLQNPQLQKAYIGCSSAIPCWIHPKAAVGSRALPEYVVYQDVVVGKRATMRGVTVVPSELLYRLGNTMCTFSNPLDDPPPFYDSKQHCLMCFAVPRFGVHTWELPTAAVPLPPDDKDRYRLFARYFLEGRVAPALKKFAGSLKSKPTSVMGRVAQPRVLSLVRALSERQVDSLPALQREWGREPQFLLDIFLLWVQQSHHSEIRKMWPPKK